MTAWDYIKTKGLTMAIVSRETGQTLQTLRNWYNNPKKRAVLDLCIEGIKAR